MEKFCEICLDSQSIYTCKNCSFLICETCVEYGHKISVCSRGGRITNGFHCSINCLETYIRINYTPTDVNYLISAVVNTNCSFIFVELFKTTQKKRIKECRLSQIKRILCNVIHVEGLQRIICDYTIKI